MTKKVKVWFENVDGDYCEDMVGTIAKVHKDDSLDGYVGVDTEYGVFIIPSIQVYYSSSDFAKKKIKDCESKIRSLHSTIKYYSKMVESEQGDN